MRVSLDVRQLVSYLRVSESGALPCIDGLKPFRAAVVCDRTLSEQRQLEVSRWLCQSGCLYMSAWGAECSKWDDSVDLAHLEAYDYEDVPEDGFVMTTWHEEESLEDFFFFVNSCAYHPSIELSNTLILHVADHDREEELCAYLDAA